MWTHHDQKLCDRLGLLFKNTRELDVIIDRELPGRPHFQHHVITVGSKACEVFYQDVVECIRSLFRDPNFTLYLRLAPEKHYTDNTKDTQMYHNLHTGRWWWATQVSPQIQMPRYKNYDLRGSACKGTSSRDHCSHFTFHR